MTVIIVAIEKCRRFSIEHPSIPRNGDMCVFRTILFCLKSAADGDSTSKLAICTARNFFLHDFPKKYYDLANEVLLAAMARPKEIPWLYEQIENM